LSDKESEMAREPKEIVIELLEGIRDPKIVRGLCAADVTYVSLNYSNPDLHKIMPWCGTAHGVEAIIQTFADVGRFWNVDLFMPEDIFGEGDRVAVFGRFTYTSTKMGKTVTSPFAILFRLKSEKVEYMQFMEDTFCTGSSFRSGGTWKFLSDPNGGEVEI
jgi:uncharacterized protein